MTDTTEMPVEINADKNTDWLQFPERIRIYRDNTGSNDWGDADIDTESAEVLYTRTDTIPKVTVIRQRKDGYWEALSDGSEIFKAYDEEIESDYMDKHPDHGSMVEEAWVQVPAGKWIGCHPDSSLEEFKEEFEEAGYQVFAIPSKAEVAREFFETADKLAGQKMQRTGVIAGAHYAAMKQLLKEWEDAESKANHI